MLQRENQVVILQEWGWPCDQSSIYSNDRPAHSSRSINNVYKRAILHFRSLYSFVRLLPAYSMKRHIVEGAGGHQQPSSSSSLGIGYRLSSTDMPRQDEVDLGKYQWLGCMYDRWLKGTHPSSIIGDTLLSEDMDAVEEHTLNNLQTPLG